ncbi:CopG family transcriptional regulator [Acidiphilium sp. AL]|uniref:CopG family transcriptional regulator n=1 Tax=Acidiphilium iwatense TaxID=768198 RepID=A0ABS9E2J0_9PROT|nr:MULTISPECIES: CopG family transcriptional regulator [Acidiphilium]MCF3948558.1 CopG family transcriptional regulator [Acidiphilium iwatense]MCU4162001.1 CopG family transcriptional regulator [Acidiphilium sp. AL]
MIAKPASSIFDPADDAEEAGAMAETEADVTAGRMVSHEAVSWWFQSCGTPNELLLPECR